MKASTLLEPVVLCHALDELVFCSTLVALTVDAHAMHVEQAHAPKIVHVGHGVHLSMHT